MIVLVGLGNPGEKYVRHRHNIGFMAVDAIADKYNFSAAKKKHRGEIREGFLECGDVRTKALIVKPQTFMNESGNCLRAISDFHKLSPSDFFVFYDELDLAPGKLRVKTGGGAAGHNGIRSIDSHLGNEFRRVRIGIGHPGEKARVSGHVLGDFAKSDQDWLAPLLDAIANSAPFLGVDDQRFASSVAQQLTPERSKKSNPVPKDYDQRSAVEESNPQPQVNPFAEAFKNLFGTKK